jgi:hypothetical protein
MLLSADLCQVTSHEHSHEIPSGIQKGDITDAIKKNQKSLLSATILLFKMLQVRHVLHCSAAKKEEPKELFHSGAVAQNLMPRGFQAFLSRLAFTSSSAFTMSSILEMTSPLKHLLHLALIVVQPSARNSKLGSEMNLPHCVWLRRVPQR